jgi:hypothetical protein
MGADIVIAVNVDTTLHPVKPHEMCTLRRLTGRVADIFMWSKDSASATEADLTIYPNVDAVRVIEKSPAKVRLSIEQARSPRAKQYQRSGNCSRQFPTWSGSRLPTQI